jgi:hypothetical protein
LDKLETLGSVIASSGSAVFAYEKPNKNNECIIYSLISNVPIRSMDKVLLEKSHVQLDCYSKTLEGSRNTVVGLKTLLDCKTSGSFKASYFDDDKCIKDLESGLYRSILDLYIW